MSALDETTCLMLSRFGIDKRYQKVDSIPKRAVYFNRTQLQRAIAGREVIKIYKKSESSICSEYGLLVSVTTPFPGDQNMFH